MCILSLWLDHVLAHPWMLLIKTKLAIFDGSDIFADFRIIIGSKWIYGIVPRLFSTNSHP